MTFSNKVYGVLKQIALVWLPAAATFYAALAGVWGFPDVVQVVATISAVDTALGGLLHISSASYNSATDGNLVIDKSDPDKDTYSIELTTPLDTVDQKNAIKLNVTPAKS